jgi:hypothetical protein
MKYLYLLLILTLTVVSFTFKDVFETAHIYQKSPLNGGGAPAGRSGAPGEQNCTACHSGSVLNGDNENVLTLLNGGIPVTNYTPGQTYTVSLVMSSNPTKKGFQSTALDANNLMAGTFAGQAGNTSINGTTKKYANHTSMSNTNVTAPVWSWSWTAPSAGTGDVTFYVASNKANGNGNDNGDLIYLSQHIISEQGAGITENESVSAFNLFYAADTKLATVTFESLQQGSMSINLSDMNGKIWNIKQNELVIIGKNKMTLDLSGSYPKGAYVLQAIINGKPFTKNIIIN